MKVITLNIRHDKDRWNERLPLIVATLVTEKPDIVAFQEVETKIKQSLLIVNDMNKILGEDIYWEKSFPRPNRTEGLAFLFNRQSVRVLDYDVREFREGDRIAVRVFLEYQNRRFDITNVHLHDKPIDDEKVRLEQAKSIMNWLKGSGILLGDFNTNPESITIQHIQERYISVSQSYWGKEPQSTYPTPLRMNSGLIITPKTVDYIFFDQRQFEVKKAKIVFSEASPDDELLYPSDHLGILAEFS